MTSEPPLTKQTQVQASLVQLSKEITGLNDNLAMLSKRLEGVLRSESEDKKAATSEDRPAKVHLSEAIDEHVTGVERARNIVSDLLARLEL